MAEDFDLDATVEPARPMTTWPAASWSLCNRGDLTGTLFCRGTRPVSLTCI